MDTSRHLGTRRILAVAALLGAVALLARPIQAQGSTIHDGTARQRAVVGWALGRYREAGLDLPALDIYFHADPSGCGGNSGLYLAGRLDVCAGDQDTPYVRKTIVHELAHAWADRNVTAEVRAAFLQARGLPTWDDRDEPWGLRGAEQAAEVIAWAIGPGLEPLIPGHPTADELSTSYRILTGETPPHLPS